MKTETIYLKTFAYVWIYILIMSGLAFWIFDRDTMVSFFLGSVVSVFLMSHNYKSTVKKAAVDPQGLKTTAMRNYFFRYAFYIIILTVAYFSEGLEIIPVFVGFLSFKIVMVLNFALSRKGMIDDD